VHGLRDRVLVRAQGDRLSAERARRPAVDRGSHAGTTHRRFGQGWPCSSTPRGGVMSNGLLHSSAWRRVYLIQRHRPLLASSCFQDGARTEASTSWLCGAS
jgi:hypothetical protein